MTTTVRAPAPPLQALYSLTVDWARYRIETVARRGFVRATSPDVPGLEVTAPTPGAVSARLPAAIRQLVDKRV